MTARELAIDLSVGVRSIFRDLDTLRERGYPIEAARGRGGGLRLHANWGLGRVLLSRSEALCSLLGLAVAEKLGFPMFAREIGSARRRIAGAFPSAERRRIAPLRERIFVGAPASAAVRLSYRDPASAPMRELQLAFVDERVVEVEYTKEEGESTHRRLEPHALVINWPAWYLMAHDHLRGEPRTFRLDRFVAVTVEADSFRPRPRRFVELLLDSSGSTLDRI